MYSSIIQIIFALTGLAPIFLSCWVVKTIQNAPKLTCYLNLGTFRDIYCGIIEIIVTHYLLFTFIAIIIICKILMNHAIKTLPVGSIKVKSIKPVDANLSSILFSYALPWFKFFINGFEDWIFLVGTIFVYIIICILWKSSYHYNLIIKLILGYRNYEIKTINEVTYLMLSKEKLINPNQVSKYVQLSDYMIINVSNK